MSKREVLMVVVIAVLLAVLAYPEIRERIKRENERLDLVIPANDPARKQ